jgi:hypothetical protein
MAVAANHDCGQVRIKIEERALMNARMPTRCVNRNTRTLPDEDHLLHLDEAPGRKPAEIHSAR